MSCLNRLVLFSVSFSWWFLLNLVSEGRIELPCVGRSCVSITCWRLTHVPRASISVASWTTFRREFPVSFHGVIKVGTSLCFQFLYRCFDFRAATFVAAVFLCVEPRAVKRAMQVIREDVEITSFFADLPLTTLALLKVVEVRGAMRVYVFHQRILIDFDCFHFSLSISFNR